MSSRTAGVGLMAALAGMLACGCDTAAPTPIKGCPNLKGYATCDVASVTEPFATRPARVLLVVERSGRLLRMPPGATESTWEAMTRGLAAALDRPWGNVEFAMLGYPSAMSTGCGDRCCYMLPADSAVRGPFGPESAARIVEVLLSDSPEGEAPMASALATARQYLTEVDVAAGGDVFVVLVAGGGPDCNGGNACDADRCVPNLEGRCAAGGNCCDGAPELCLDDPAVSEQVQALAGAGISTVVVGLPGAGDFTAVFDDLARAGGLPDPATGGAYRPGATASEIEATMTAIFAGLGDRCQATVPAVVLPEAARVAVDCQVESAAQLHPDETSGTTQVIFEGDSCGALVTDAPPAVNVLYRCASLPRP